MARSTPRRNAKGRFVKGNRGGARRKPARRTSARRAPARRRRRNPATRAAQRGTYARLPTMRTNPRKRRSTRRRVRRNQLRIPTMNQLMGNLIIPAATGTVGAIANDLLYTYIPWPEAMKSTQWGRFATKGLTAVGMTMIAGMAVNQRTASHLGVGAFVQLFSDLARQFMVTNGVASDAALEGMGVYTMGYYNPALPAGGGMDGMGLYVPGNQMSAPGQLPSLSPSQNVGEYVENGYSYA